MWHKCIENSAFVTAVGARSRTVIAMTEDTLLTIEEAAQFTSLSSKTIRRLVGSRELEHIRIGRSIRIRTSALESYLESRTVRPLWLEEEVA